MAAGEEIEQPFGYGRHTYFPCALYLLTVTLDKNDLDLDYFCRGVIHVELEDIRRVSCANSDLGVPGAVENNSLVGYGVVVDAALRRQAAPGTVTSPMAFGTDHSLSNSNSNPTPRQQGTSTQNMLIMSGASNFPVGR